jgi:hypothetical protein
MTVPRIGGLFSVRPRGALRDVPRLRWRSLAAVSIAVPLVLAAWSIAPAFANDPLIKLSTDPYVDPASQHKTEVEPDTFTFGTTVVSAFQVGRFFNGGASNGGFATSLDSGATWKHGFLPGSTTVATPPGTYNRVSDTSVAYDAKHKTWLISWLGLITPDPTKETSFLVDVDVSRSTDGGLTWGNPIVVNPNPGTSFLDKNWTACDNTPTSPHYGNCYTEYDDTNRNDLEQMSTSSDGGLTWGANEQVAGPMQLSWLPNTSQGFMVGDYISTSIVKGADDVVPAFAVAHKPTGTVLDEATYTIANEDLTIHGGEVAAEVGGLQARSAVSVTPAASSGLGKAPSLAHFHTAF